MTKPRIDEALYDEKINKWLRLFAGDRYEKVCDWIAAVPLLQHPCCALHISGPPAIGKSLLASGLARLWHQGPPTLVEDALGNFNSDIEKCPLVLAEDTLGGTSKFRALVEQSLFKLNEKYRAPREMQNSIRLMICTTGSTHAKAAEGRILHVQGRRDAAEWLRKNNSEGRLTRSWVEGDLIARHCLWLSENREIVPGRRFLVEGE